MTVLDLRAADLDIIIGPGDRNIVFEFVDNPLPNLAGTWLFQVRKRPGATGTVLISGTVDLTNIGTGLVEVSFTEAQLLGLVASGKDEWRGAYTFEKDTVPWFQGDFVVQQKASGR